MIQNYSFRAKATRALDYRGLRAAMQPYRTRRHSLYRAEIQFHDRHWLSLLHQKPHQKLHQKLEEEIRTTYETPVHMQQG